MFTGIITEIGRVVSSSRASDGVLLKISAPATAQGLAVGGSVAVDGVCLTAIEVSRRGFSAQVVPETIARSTLTPLLLGVKGRKLNLERPLAASGELSGHFVQGHVDATARVVSLREVSGGVRLAVELPARMRGLVVEKGSIAVNGVSLTVASTVRSPGTFSVALVPHTLARTNLGVLRKGDLVNLEADILGKYVRELTRRRR